MKHTIIILLISIFFITCKRTPVPEEHEAITKMTMVLLDSLGNKSEFKYTDPDGDGGVNPSIDTVYLKGSKKYTGTWIILNELKTPVLNITDEIEKDKNHHQFFYTPSTDIISKMDCTITDFDDNSLPVGVKYQIICNSVNQKTLGKLRIVLSHYDAEKSTLPSTESDIDFEFPIVINP